MNLRLVPNPLPSEKLVGVFPALRPHVPDADRLARLNFFPGRHLTDTALDQEQTIRVTRLRLRGQAVSPGIAAGLEITLINRALDPALNITPGQALTADGDDIVLPRSLSIPLRSIDAFDPDTGGYAPRLAELDSSTPATFAAVLLLQPGYVRASTPPLGTTPPDLIGSFVPTEGVSPDAVYDRTTLTDAARVLFCRWPDLPEPGPAWRNRIAWAVFDAEQRGLPLPWHRLGAPLALIGFDQDTDRFWVDRYAVARPGGRPAPRRFWPSSTAPAGFEVFRGLWPNAGEAHLWQARFNQFCTHLADLAAKRPAAADFAQLPPAGVLPAAFLDRAKVESLVKNKPYAWALTQHFFPKDWIVDVAVAPSEQIPAVLAATQALEPFNLSRPDTVRILLPVPQRFFDPDLLEVAGLAPEFDERIADYSDRRAACLALRYDLWQRRRRLDLVLNGIADPADPTDTGPVDTNESRGNPPSQAALNLLFNRLDIPTDTPPGTPDLVRAFAVDRDDKAPAQADPVSRYASTVAQRFVADAAATLGPFRLTAAIAENKLPNGTTATELEVLNLLANEDGARDEVTAFIDGQAAVAAKEDELFKSVGSTRGLRDFIAQLERRVDQADRLVDSGFLKTRIDVLRLSHLLANNSLGTQFAASPSLAAIVQRRTELNNPSQIQSFASQLLANFAPSAIPSATDSANARTTAKTDFTSSNFSAIALQLKSDDFPSLIKTILAEIAKLNPHVRPAQKTALAKLIKDLDPTDPPAAVDEALHMVDSLDGSTAEERKRIAVLLSQIKAGTDAPLAQGILEQISKSDSLSQEQKDLAASLLDRGVIDRAAAVETFAQTYIPNLNLLSQKQLRAIPLDRLQPPLAPNVRADLQDARFELFERLARLPISLGGLATEFVEALPPTIAIPAKPGPARFGLYHLISRRSRDVLATNADGAIVDADESKHFTSGVKHADMSLAALRAVESRIAQYRLFLDRCRACLAEIDQTQSRLRRALGLANRTLAEARQDVAVATSLRTEELDRLDRLNAHRALILDRQVRLLVFHRPRALTASQPAPQRPLNPALTQDPVPAVLREDITLPTELVAFREVLRHSPARWFTQTRPWLNAVNRWDHLHWLLRRAAARDPVPDDSPLPIGSGRYSDTLNSLLNSHRDSARQAAAATTRLRQIALDQLSWIDLRRHAEENLTLGHLIDAGPAQLARAAAAELENLFKLDAGLLRDFGRISALLRLAWAERFSEFDAPADFRDLSRLPRWSEIDFTLRRHLQILVDWLFGRFDATQPAALALANDLVRIALLLASHAPVDQLITGRLNLPGRLLPAPGLLLQIQTDPLRVHRGMSVSIPASLSADHPGEVRAVVEDITPGFVAARVTATRGTIGHLIPNLVVRFIA
jgi:hypothetical protein